MENENLETLQELINKFDTGYYEKEIEQLQQQISNIRLGRPKNEGIYENVASEIVPVSKREKEIKKIQNRIDDIKKNKATIGENLTQMRTLSSNLERLVEQELLLDALERQLRIGVSEERKETEIYKENSSKYFKLYKKSTTPLTQLQRKISKEIYKKIKENMSKKVYRKSNTRYISMSDAFEKNKIDLNVESKDKFVVGDKIVKDVTKKYERSYDDPHFDASIPFSHKLTKLGVNFEQLKYAREQVKGEIRDNSLTWHGKDAYDIFKKIEQVKTTNIQTKGGFSKLNEIKEKIDKIIELSRETWYLEKTLDAFSTTSVTETAMYKGLQELVKEQEKELQNLINEVNNAYNKTGLENKLDLAKELEELYKKSEELKLSIENLRQMKDNWQANIMEQDYYNIRYEMIKILKDNPDLNIPKYNIDIEKIKKRERESYKNEIEKPIKKDQSSYIETSEERIFIDRTAPRNEKSDNVESLETNAEELVNIEKLDIGSNLQILRTSYYQKYMTEKVLNSDLGKLSFSAYLEAVAPRLTELIETEKEREKIAKTVYKDYLKYISTLENKAFAMRFEEFAKNNYGISNINVPVVYDEEYKGMRK